jgi:hypothetical protein
MNFFKKIIVFFTYRSKINTIKEELKLEYNAKIDSIYRIYTVLNLPPIIFEEPYNLRTYDIDQISRNYILDFRRNISDFLIKRGLMELFELYEIRKVDKYSYLIIFGFSLFNTKKAANSIITTSIFLFLFLVLFFTGLIIYNFIN